MAQERLDLVTQVIAAWNRRDLEAILSLAHPDIEYVNPPTAIEPGVRSGHQEVGLVFRKQWAGLGPDAWQEIDDTHAVGEDLVTTGVVAQTMPGGSTRIENRIALRWSFAGDRLARLEVLGAGSDFEDALRALGLSA